jgi:DNA-directed RNA polymerase specialized sigma24 family protein
LYYVADLPVEQIAHDRGIPVGTVKSRLAAGRRRLELGPAQDQASSGGGQ